MIATENKTIKDRLRAHLLSDEVLLIAQRIEHLSNEAREKFIIAITQKERAEGSTLEVRFYKKMAFDHAFRRKAIESIKGGMVFNFDASNPDFVDNQVAYSDAT